MKKRLKRKNFFGCNVRLNASCTTPCQQACPPIPTHYVGATGAFQLLSNFN